MLWRVARGNIYLKHAAVVQLPSTETGSSLLASLTEQMPAKEVFIAFYQGDQLHTKIKKICDAFHAVVHTFPDTLQERIRVKAGIETRIADLVSVLQQTEDHRDKLLLNSAARLRLWQTQVAKTKSVYHELNKFNIDYSNKCLIGEGWTPSTEVEHVRDALMKASTAAGSAMTSFLQIQDHGDRVPPTYFRLNKFTRAFQNIVHAYGVASYREINPALYTTITFPFLFAVMFGDIGHGFIMFLAGLFLCLKEKELARQAANDESFGMFFGGRYIITLMGLFSMYTGFIYNDIFSKSIKLTSSSWYVDPNMTIYIDKNNPSGSSMMLEPVNRTNWRTVVDEPYPFGLDPIWNVAENEIMFVDSMKMKMSVILGVIQMFFGILLSVGNYLHFRRYLDILTQFVPMLLFMAGIFMYVFPLTFLLFSFPNPVIFILTNSP